MSSITNNKKPVSLGFDPAYLAEFEEKLFIEGAQKSRRLVNFFTLLLLATVIATYGVLSGSTATVIGAMIVAPLMGPIMATTAAVVMGSPQRALSAFALTLAGTISVIAAAFFLALIVPDISISFTNNGEIASRINPGLYALITALGAGAAGAFITSRAEIADSIGGVAIAISLVPPLTVVGISFQHGRLDAAGGAMLLFLTNYLAILFAGGIVLLIVGLGKHAGIQADAHVRRRGFALFIIGILLVAIPLSVSTYQVVSSLIQNQAATTVLNEWLEGTTYRVVAVQIENQGVLATLEGNGELNSIKQLDNLLTGVLQQPVTIRLRILPLLTDSSAVP